MTLSKLARRWHPAQSYARQSRIAQRAAMRIIEHLSENNTAWIYPRQQWDGEAMEVVKMCIPRYFRRGIPLSSFNMWGYKTEQTRDQIKARLTKRPAEVDMYAAHGVPRPRRGGISLAHIADGMISASIPQSFLDAAKMLDQMREDVRREYDESPEKFRERNIPSQYLGTSTGSDTGGAAGDADAPRDDGEAKPSPTDQQ